VQRGPDDVAQMRAICEDLAALCGQIGAVPPLGASLRGRAARLAARAMRVGLLWYTPPIKASIGTLARLLAEELGRTQQLEARLTELERQIAELKKGANCGS